jgi:hypothetical protein
MSRAAWSKTKTTIVAVVAVVIVGVGGVWAYVANSPSHQVHTIVNAQRQITQISYQGQKGSTALSLLKKHATVQTKHYSFGDLVTSINGNVGNGPKYWTFYINGKQAKVGASSYITKDSDTISWRLQ